MLYRHIMMLNDLVSFIRFSLNDSPYIKTSGPINRLFQQMHIADRSTESFHATEILLIPQDIKLRRVLNPFPNDKFFTLPN